RPRPEGDDPPDAAPDLPRLTSATDRGPRTASHVGALAATTGDLPCQHPPRGRTPSSPSPASLSTGPTALVPSTTSAGPSAAVAPASSDATAPARRHCCVL